MYVVCMCMCNVYVYVYLYVFVVCFCLCLCQCVRKGVHVRVRVRVLECVYICVLSRSFFCLKRFTRHSVTRFRWLMKSRKQDRKRKKSVFYSLPRFVRKNRQKKFPRKNTLPLLKIGQLWEKVEEKLWAENWHVKNPFIIF